MLAPMCGAGVAPCCDSCWIRNAVSVIWRHSPPLGYLFRRIFGWRIGTIDSDAEAPSIPVARVSVILPWVEFSSKEGAPSEALLERTGIHPELLRQPDAVLPLKRAFRWIELVGQSLDTAQLGVHVGGVTPIEVLGLYGRILVGALPLNQYLRQGIALYRTIITGQTVWLLAHGNRVRGNLGAPWKPRPGDCQARLNFLAITIANIRRFAGPYWSPSELSFGCKPREPLPVDVFGDPHVVYRPGQTYLECPRSLLGLRLGQGDQRPATGGRPHHFARPVAERPLGTGGTADRVLAVQPRALRGPDRGDARSLSENGAVASGRGAEPDFEQN